MRRAINIWKETFFIIKKHPKVLLPFVILVIFQSIALWLLFLAPQPPFSYLLAPPIRAFFGERFLHYPFNLLLLPKLYYYANVMLSASMGILMTALSIGMLKEINAGKLPKIFSNLKKAVRYFFPLFGIWFIIFFISFSSKKIFNAFNIKINLPFSFVLYFILIIIQLFFIYAIPSIIIERRKFFSAIKESFYFIGKYFRLTFMLVAIPNFFYIPLIFLRNNMGLIKSSPDMIIFVLGAEIMFSFLIDILTTVPPVLIFLKVKKGEL